MISVSGDKYPQGDITVSLKMGPAYSLLSLMLGQNISWKLFIQADIFSFSPVNNKFLEMEEDTANANPLGQ